MLVEDMCDPRKRQTVKAGAWFSLSQQEESPHAGDAMENHLPVIYLVDSAGVFLPMQV